MWSRFDSRTRLHLDQGERIGRLQAAVDEYPSKYLGRVLGYSTESHLIVATPRISSAGYGPFPGALERHLADGRKRRFAARHGMAGRAAVAGSDRVTQAIRRCEIVGCLWARRSDAVLKSRWPNPVRWEIGAIKWLAI
jgi:hypothetical protein